MTFEEYLVSKKELHIFVDPCSGNNGDKLIYLGMQEVLNKVGVNIVTSPSKADVIIINGGGMFIDAYTQGINKVSYYTQNYPDKELCIAPNSFGFKQTDFRSVLKERKTALTIFYREMYSGDYIKEIIKGLSFVTAHLDHDLAFHLEGGDFVKDILAKHPKPIRGNLLVVDRMDIEHSKVTKNGTLIRQIYSSMVPRWFKSKIAERRFKIRNRLGSKLTQIAIKTIKVNDKDYLIDSVETSDISRIDICSFDDFIIKIANADYVFTNRLHVGVLAHLLGRKTYMCEGSYHKMTGIYEFSMQNKLTTRIINNG